jgi:hypothetical protein
MLYADPDRISSTGTQFVFKFFIGKKMIVTTGTTTPP